jgi:hypothetical protein
MDQFIEKERNKRRADEEHFYLPSFLPYVFDKKGNTVASSNCDDTIRFIDDECISRQQKVICAESRLNFIDS